MKYFKIFLLFFLFSFSVSEAQEVIVESAFDQRAEPYEGLAVFRKNFINKLNVSKANGNAVNITLKFVVDVDGSFTDITVSKDKYDLGKDVILALKKMPKWKPAYDKGKPVRSTFTMPIVIEADDRQDFIETIFDEKLENVEMETSFFKFSCNCIASEQQIDETDIKYQFEYLTNTGMYKLVVIKADESNFEQIKYYQRDLLDSREIQIEEVEYLGVHSLNYDETLDIEEGVFYSKNRFFYKDDLVYMLFYMSKDKTETERVFNELLESFQIKK